MASTSARLWLCHRSILLSSSTLYPRRTCARTKCHSDKQSQPKEEEVSITRLLQAYRLQETSKCSQQG